MTAALHKVSREIGTALRFGVVGAAATGVHVGVALSLFLKTSAGTWPLLTPATTDAINRFFVF